MQTKTDGTLSTRARFAGLGIAAFAALSLSVATPALAAEETAPPTDDEAAISTPQGLDAAQDKLDATQDELGTTPGQEAAEAEAPALTEDATPAAEQDQPAAPVDEPESDVADATVTAGDADAAEEAGPASPAGEDEPATEADGSGDPATAPQAAAGEATQDVQTPDEPTEPMRVEAEGETEPVIAPTPGFTGIMSEKGVYRYYQNGVVYKTPGVIKVGGKLYVVANASGTLLAPKNMGASYAYRTHKGEKYLLYRDKKTGAFYVKAGYAKKKGMQTYTRPDTGALVRNGAYVVKNKRGGRVIIASKSGRLARLSDGSKRGWVVSSSWGAQDKRYYLYRDGSGADKGMYYAKLGYSGNGYAHITSEKGYVRTKTLKTSDGRIYVINKKGRVASLEKGKDRGWLTSSDYVKGSHRYHLTKDTAGLYKGAYYAVLGYQDKAASGTYAHYTKKNGSVATGTVIEVEGAYYVANAKGKLSRLKQLCGVDIFSGEGEANINISKLTAQFVIVKATQGTKYVNPYWKKHADEVLKAGKLLGFYHYAATNYNGGDPTKEADFFLKTIGTKYIGKAVLALDWESIQNDNFGTDKKAVKWCKTFLDRVYSKTGVLPLIYMSRSVAQGGDWKSVSDAGYGLWMAQYLYDYYNGSDTPHVEYQANPRLSAKGGYGSWAAPTIYQYTSEGKDPNFKNCLDFNTYYGTHKDWAKLAAVVTKAALS